LGEVSLACHHNYVGGISRSITVQASQAKIARYYLKKAKSAGDVA
jgi:hypothetical protein